MRTLIRPSWNRISITSFRMGSRPAGDDSTRWMKQTGQVVHEEAGGPRLPLPASPVRGLPPSTRIPAPPTAVVHADAAAQHGQDAADLGQLAVLLCTDWGVRNEGQTSTNNARIDSPSAEDSGAACGPPLHRLGGQSEVRDKHQ